MALVGVGHLGKAILHYGGFVPQGFHVIAAFDIDPATVGQEIAGLVVQNVRELPSTLATRHVDIGIVAVPAREAQGMIDLLVSAGVEAVLNYAPIAAHVPAGVHVRHIDPVLSLQSMTFYVKGNSHPYE
jgi:redox-sensing transcriptional repressor